MTKSTHQRSTVAQNDKRLTPVKNLRVPPAPPQPKRIPVPVDLPAAGVKKEGALIPSAHGITGQVLGNNGVTTARNRGGPAAALRGGGRDGAAVAGAIMAKPPVATRTPAAPSAPRQAAAPTAVAAAATPATATTAKRAAGGGTPNAPQTLSTSEEEAEDVDDPGDIVPPLLPQKNPDHVHAVTAAGRGTGGTIAAAREAPAAGAAAPARDPGGAATAEATAQPAAPPAPPRALLVDELPGLEWKPTHNAETSTARASTAPSLRVHLPHGALTATPIHPAHSL